MPVQKFLELDSTYRNRNADPNPADFTVNISQYGIKGQQNAVDPVSNAYPQIVFSPQQYTNTNLNNFFGNFTLLLPPSTPNTLYLQYTPLSEGRPVLPTTKDFFVGLDIVHNEGTPKQYRRISEWECIQNITSTQIFKATVDSPFTSFTPGISATLAIPIYQTYPLYFLPASLCIPDYYNKFYLQNQTRTFYSGNAVPPTTLKTVPAPEYASIIDFDRDSHYASAGPLIAGNLNNWLATDTYVIRKEIPIVSSILQYDSVSNTSVKVGNNFFKTTAPNTLTNSFINFYSLSGTSNTNVNAKIIGSAGTTTWGQQIIVTDATEPTVEVVKNDGTIEVVYLDTLILSSALPSIAKTNDLFEILQFSNDNCSPFVYTGTMSSNSQPVSYDMTLNSLTLPNRLLQNGGRIAYYPYVYVIIENISTTGGNPKNMIYSNNPNTYKAVFRAPITDMNHPAVTPFVKLNGNGMKQTMVFKQNDDMSITILLPNGEVFKTEENDTTNGNSPNPVLQISAVFSMERIQ